MLNAGFHGISTPRRAVVIAAIVLGVLTGCDGSGGGGDITLAATRIEGNPPGAMAHVCWVTVAVKNDSETRLNNLIVRIGLEHNGERSPGAAEVAFKDVGAGGSAEARGSLGLSTINRANKAEQCPTTKPYLARVEKCDLGDLKESDCEKKVALKN